MAGGYAALPNLTPITTPQTASLDGARIVLDAGSLGQLTGYIDARAGRSVASNQQGLVTAAKYY
jgi:hypothetical protein